MSGGWAGRSIEDEQPGGALESQRVLRDQFRRQIEIELRLEHGARLSKHPRSEVG